MAKTKETKVENTLEREYTINLRDKVSVVPRYKRTPKAIRTIKEFIARHMSVKERNMDLVRIDKYLNEQLWSRGIKNPPMKIKVKAIKDSDGIVRVELSEYPDALKFKKLREEKINKASEEKAPKKTEIKEEPKAETTEEKKEEIKEKEKASAEATQKIEKAIEKEMKHETPFKKKTNIKDHGKGKQGH